jgi:hypothetical protein
VRFPKLTDVHILFPRPEIFNPEKQDDGSARRLFLDTLSQFLADSDGNIIDVTFEGFFVLTFVFGTVENPRKSAYLY